jgi:epoxyqueuosine reductase
LSAPTATGEHERVNATGAAVLAAEVCELGREAGLAAVGVASAEPFDDARRALEERKAEGRHGGMQFTYRNPARSTDPASALASARALVVGARGYRSGTPPEPTTGPHGRVARYVRDDAYGALDRGLQAMADRLREDGFRAVVVADQNTLVDRAAAHRAGLGWYGKSSNLLLPGQGSWFVLGSVVTDAPLPARAEPVEDGCGTCRRCLDGCPTGAIVAPGVVDARRCLAWLVQSPEPFPMELRTALGDRLYGCDDCQEVCPPNRRPRGTGPTSAPADGAAADAWVDVVALLESDDETLLDRFGRWYIPDRDPRYLRRTALVVLGNVGAADRPEVRRVIERYRNGSDELLAEHAAWAAGRLGLVEARPGGEGA